MILVIKAQKLKKKFYGFYCFTKTAVKYLAPTHFKYLRQALYFLNLPWVIRGNLTVCYPLSPKAKSRNTMPGEGT